MVKFLFKVLIAVALLGVASYGLAATGTMPQEAYSRGLGFVAALRGGAGPFDGTWVAQANSSIAETEDAFCGTAYGEFIVQGNHMYGSVRSEFGDTYMISAQVDRGGDVAGGMALGMENVARFEGVLYDSDGEGSWSDELGCYGTVSFRRITALGSHDARYIRDVSGRAFVVRDMRTLLALPGTVLRPGDTLAVEEGSDVLIVLGSHKLRIGEKTKFEIPQEDAVRQEPSIMGRTWTALKYLLQGPSFEIKVPEAVAGVRG